MYRLLCVATVTVVLFATTGAVIGQDDLGEASEPAVQHELVTELILEQANYRASVKEAMQGHLRAIGLIVTLRTPLEEQLPLHANAMLTLSKIHGSLYAAGSESPGTSASIWTNSEAFAAAGKEFESSAEKFSAAVEGGNRHFMFNTLTQLGESCENCHSQFRVTTE